MSLPSLLRDFQKFERVRKYPDQEILDLSNFRFVAPTTLLPAYHYAISNSISKYVPHENTREYLDQIFGRSQCNEHTLPLLQINLNQDEMAKIKILSSVNNKIRNILFPNDATGYTEYGDAGFRYIIDEILSNVEQHSEADKLYVYCQGYPSEGYVDVGILDNGVTIPGKYEAELPEFKNKNINPYLFQDDPEALYLSVNGISTKRGFKLDLERLKSKDGIPDVDNIGCGMNTSVRTITEVLGGSMLIASREGICHLTPSEKTFIKAENHNNSINGTLMSMRFKKGEFDYDKFNECIFEYRMIKDIII